MKAILKRELRSYFSSPIGYVCVAALAALYSLFFFLVMSMGTTMYVSEVYNSMFMFCMMVIPIITMKSMSEDRKNKTDQALLTAPVGVTSIVLGKFLAAFGVYFIATMVGQIPVLFLMTFSQPPMGIIFGNIIATLLYGAAMISIGIFISSLTESQVIAAITTFVVAVVLIYIDTIGQSVGNPVVTQFVEWISFSSRYASFTRGIFNVPSAIFFLSVSSIFVFLTARRVESRRWN